MAQGSASFQEVISHARSLQPEAVSLLQELVRIPSVNGRDPETPVAERIREGARRLGLQAELVGVEAHRQNLLVSLGTGPRGFLLLGHLDTVHEGPVEAWSRPPFAGEIVEGNMIGRGTADNKAGLACGLYTLALLKESSWFDPDRYRVLMAGVVDEESGASSPLGVAHLLSAGLLPVEAAIYTYAGDIICLGHRGLIRLWLRARGQAVHSGSEEWDRGEQGVNAVTGLAEALLHLEQLDTPSPGHPAFGGLGNVITPGTIFRGGDSEGMVPGQAEALVDIRTLPGQDQEDLLQQVQRVLQRVEGKRSGLKLSMEVKNRLPGAAIPADHPLVERAVKYTGIVTGSPWPARGAGPANEGYMLIQAGIPTLCGFGPRGGNAHAPDEWVDLDSMGEAMAMYAGIIQETLSGS